MSDEQADNANNMARALCKVGSVITVTIKITDTDKAMQLLGTMYGKNDDLGVEVQEWGFFDIKRAQELQIQKALEILGETDLSKFLDELE